MQILTRQTSYRRPRKSSLSLLPSGRSFMASTCIGCQVHKRMNCKSSSGFLYPQAIHTALPDRYSLPKGASFVSSHQSPVSLCHLSNWGASLPKSEPQYSRAAGPRPSLGTSSQTRDDTGPERARLGRGPRFVSNPTHPKI